jgi:hypothetical protein
LIEEAAQPGGLLNVSTATRLRARHDTIDTFGSLKTVLLNGFPIEGLWSMSVGADDYIFMLDGPDGDALMDKSTFENFLRNDRHRAEDFIKNRAAYRYHPALADLFGKTRQLSAIKVQFKPTHGTAGAAQALIDKLIDDTGEFTVSHSERLKILGGLLLTGLCTLATGGVAMTACVLGTLAFVTDSFANAVDAWNRGNRDEAIAEMLGAGFDLVDVFDATRMAVMLFKLRKLNFVSADDATEGLRQLARQASAFDEEGNLGVGFAQQPPSAPRAQAGVDNALEWVLDDKVYVRTGAGDFVEAPLDESGIRRAKDPQDSQAVGAPIDYQDGQWRKLEHEPNLPARFIEHLREKVPESKWADAEDIERVRAIEGVLHAGQLGAPGRRAIVSAGRKALLKDAAASGRIEKLEGTSALLVAWAMTPQVNGGLRVDIHPQSSLGTPHIRIGNGPGASIGIAPKDIPGMTIDKMIEQAGHASLVSGLALNTDVSPAELKAAAVQRLQQTLSSRQGDIVGQWESVENALKTASDAVQVLRKYYPNLTADEAEELLRSDPDLLIKAKRADNLGFAMSNVAGRRHQRATRGHILDGNVSTLDEISTLGVLLQQALPGIRTRVIGGESHIDLHLEHLDIQGKTSSADIIRFSGAGNVQTLKDGSWVKASHWEEAVGSALSDAERAALGNRGVRDALKGTMARRPLAELCPIRSRGPRADCSAEELSAGLSRVSLTPLQERVSETLHPQVVALRASANQVLENTMRTADAAFIDQYLKVHKDKNHIDYRTLDQLNELGFLGRAELAAKQMGGPSSGKWKPKDTNPATVMSSAHKKRNELLKANLMTAEVNLQYEGRTIRFENHYSSNRVTNELGLDIQPADTPRNVVVKASKKVSVHSPAAEPSSEDPGVLNAADFYINDVDREGLLEEDYLFGTDAWQVSGDWEFDSAQFKAPRLMTQEARRALKADKRKNVDEKTLSMIKDGEYFYEATIRACSESSFFNDFWNQLAKAIPEKFVRGTPPKDFSGLTGSIAIVTESAPCREVCSRRLRTAMDKMSHVRFSTGYIFTKAADAIRYRQARTSPPDLKFFEDKMPEVVTIGAFQ